MMKWPFNEGDAIVSVLGGPSTGMLDAYWEQGMEYTAWTLIPRGDHDLGDITWLKERSYMAEIFNPGTGNIVYKGPVTFVDNKVRYRLQRYPEEILKEDWLHWVNSNYPARFTSCT